MVPVLVWAAFTAWDAYDAYKTAHNPNALTGEKVFNYGMLASDFTPVGIIGKVAKVGKIVNRAVDAVKAVGKADNVAKESVKLMRRDNLLNGVRNEKLKNVIKDLYRELKPGERVIGDGGAIDAYLHTKRTGELVGGTDHVKKIDESIRRLEKIINNNNLSKWGWCEMIKKLTFVNLIDTIIELFPEYKEYNEYAPDYLKDEDFKNLLLDIFGRFVKNRIETYSMDDSIIQRFYKFINEQFNESKTEKEVLDYLTMEIFENISPSEKGMEVSRKLLKGKALEVFNEVAKYY